MLEVPAVLRSLLVDAQARGMKFDDAWPAAVANTLSGRADRDEWRAVFAATRLEWQEAFTSRPVRRRLRALIALDDPERVPLEASAIVLRIPLGERPCHHCGQLIATTKKRTARYCSHACQRAANGRQATAA